MAAVNIIAKIRWEAMFADVPKARHYIQTIKAVFRSMAVAGTMVDVIKNVSMVSRVTTTALVKMVTDLVLMDEAA